MIDLINLMGKKFKNLPKTLFFEYQTIEQLASYFVQNHADHFGDSDIATATAKSDEFVASANRAESEGKSSVRLLNDNRFASMKSTQFKDSSYVEHIPLRRQNHEDAIAIVGLAGRYPEAENVAVLWDNLLQGRDSVREVPESLWDWNEFYRPGKAQPGKSYSKWGGFLDNVDQFDALYFNISPKEAETMDPQERLFLQTATHAIQDAGYTPSTLAGSSEENGDHSVGVFVGVMWGDYQLYGVQSSDPEQWTTPRSFYWAIANRLSYFYNFSGPSMAVDTACSSSLTALHLACESLRRGEINAAVAGGVNLTLHPNKYNLLAEMQFLSSDGRCRSFGEGGDGYVPGDGVGAVVLKRLADAEAAGDNIYAVIRGTAINHGGKTSGFTVPNPHRQAEMIKYDFQTAVVNPRHVSYEEAHGTCTSLGDTVYQIGLKKAYAQNDQTKNEII
jgi:polyketide synthase PksN